MSSLIPYQDEEKIHTFKLGKDDYKLSLYNINVNIKDGSSLVFNSNLRTISKFDENEWAFLEGTQRSKNKDVDVERLISGAIKQGVLINSKINEFQQVKQKYRATRINPTHMSLTIAPTMQCNLACGYCFQGLDKEKGVMKDETIDFLIDFIEKKISIGKIKTLTVVFYGGEPLIAKHAIYAISRRIITICSKYCIPYSSTIVTNGYYLTPEVANTLVELKCSSAQITVDSYKEVHDIMRPKINGKGSFDKIVENINAVIKETKLSVQCRVNVGAENIANCKKLIEHFEFLGFGKSNLFSMYFSPINASTKDSGDAFRQSLNRSQFFKAVAGLERIAESKGLARVKEIPKGILGMCSAAHNNSFVIVANGDIHKCWETAHDSSKSWFNL
ncbi:arylsulfatase regulator [Vibrio ponticus]|nr:arylsulfatase regulator [Vibrio ponticus]